MSMRLLLLVLVFSFVSVGYGREFGERPCYSIPFNCTCRGTALAISIPTQAERTVVNGTLHEADYCSPVLDFQRSCILICSTVNLKGLEHPRKGRIIHSKSLVLQFYPRIIKHEPKRSLPRSARSPTYLESELYPTRPCNTYQLENAYVSCDAWPHYRTCTIRCVFGHALEDVYGVVTNWTITCRDSENQWYPRNYTDCEPYVKCGGAKLVRPGFVTCYDRLEGPSYCDVECFDYDVYDATDKQSYECLDIDTFGPDLPHCAVSKEFTGKLVKKPYM